MGLNQIILFCTKYQVQLWNLFNKQLQGGIAVQIKRNLIPWKKHTKSKLDLFLRSGPILWFILFVLPLICSPKQLIFNKKYEPIRSLNKECCVQRIHSELTNVAFCKFGRTILVWSFDGCQILEAE